METPAFSELFPLFNAANPETLDWLLSVAVEEEYDEGEAIVTEDSWGNAVYFVTSGWVKIQRANGDREQTQVIYGRGDFFGEVAVLDEPPRACSAIALSGVELMTISAQRFIQTLFRDSQLHHKLLQLMVRRLRQANLRWQLRHHPPAAKLARLLISLAESYGKPTETGTEIIDLPSKDVADLIDTEPQEATRMLNKFQNQGWIEIVPEDRALSITNLRQLAHLTGGSELIRHS